MCKAELNIQSELKGRGIYGNEGTWYGYPYTPVERLTPPITPRENLRRFYEGRDYLWVPDIQADVAELTPDCIPDVVACGFEGGEDAFGVKWIPDVSNPELPAFVEPGFVLMEDIENWKELRFPDVDSWPWAECAARYNETLKDDDRMRRGVILSGYFERLISIMTFQNAAMALITDPESTSDFFDKLTDVNIKIADHYIDDFKCEIIMLHDDWAAQRSQFFSMLTALEVLVPHLKRLVDHIHERGAFFTFHSCGNGTALVPAMKAAGVDSWQANVTALNCDEAYAAAGADLIVEWCAFEPPIELSAEEIEDFLEDIYKKYTVKYRGLPQFYDMNFERWPLTRKLCYELGRKYAPK